MKRSIVVVGLLVAALGFGALAGESDFHQINLQETSGIDPYLSFTNGDATVVAKIIADESDANANCLVIDLPAGSATVVPVVLLTSTTSDYGYFHGETAPKLAIEDDDGDSWVSIGWTADDQPAIEVGGSASSISIPGITGNSWADDVDFGLGTSTPVSMEYTTADGNANCMIVDFPAGDSTDVPVLLLTTTDADFGYFHGYTAPTLAIEDDDGDSWIAFGWATDDVPNLDVGGSATYLRVVDNVYYGVDNTGVDVLHYGDGTGNYATWDQSLDTVTFLDYNAKFDDDAILYFGTGTNITTADGDFTMNFTDGSPGYFTVTAVTAEDVFQIGDGTIATDVLIQNTTTAGADIFWDDSGEVWQFGVDNTGVDVKLFGDGTGNYIIWDESIDTLVGVDGNIKMDDDAIIYLGTGSGVTTADGDFTVNFTDGTPGILTITAATANDRLAIGDGTTGTDVIFDNTQTAGADFVWDDSAETLYLGSDNTGIDVIMYGDTASVVTWWDESGDTWYFGADDYGPDVFVYGAGTGNYSTWDASLDTLSMVDYNQKFDDDAILYFGTGTNVTTADGDFTVNFTDGSPGYLTVTAVAAEDVFQIGDGTIATDVLIQNTTTAGADIFWDDSAELWKFGVDNTGVDVGFYGDGTGNYAMFDESIDALVFVDIDTKLDDDAILLFGTGTNVTTADGDFTMNFSDGSPGVLTLTAVANDDQFRIGDGTIGTDILIENTTTAGADISWDDSGEIWQFGVTNLGVDVKLWGDTDGDYVLFDESGDIMEFEDIEIEMQDDTFLQFGNDADYQMKYDETTNDQFIFTTTATAADATGDPMIAFIVDDAGGGCTADQEVFGVARGTDGATDLLQLDEDGDMTIAGTATFTGGQTRKVRWDPKDVELDGSNPATLADFGTDGQCNISALTFDADGGVNGDDVCYITWHVPDGYVVDSARLNVAYAISNALDAADEAQFDFAVNAVAAGEALDAAGTALADQTTVITDASADNGKLFVTQYNIEVEDIAVDDLVTIEIAVDESESDVDAGTFNVLYLEIEYESTE